MSRVAHLFARARYRALGPCLLLALVSQLASCRCSQLSGEAQDLKFTRCVQAAAPAERHVRTAALELKVRERVLSVDAPLGLRVAAFTGPVGGTLARADFAILAQAKPGLVLFLGGLGDDESAASANLAGLAALRVPTVFLPGGADRLAVVEQAFAQLSAESAELLLHASGLREMRLGQEHFAIVAGSPLGRYAVDEGACGFTLDDIADVRDALTASTRPKRAHVWLLAWGAPSGWGISHAAGSDVGSPELFALAQALSARGGLFAYPETQAGLSLRDDKRGGPALVVPRLGRSGVTRGDGGRLPSSVMLLLLTPEGLVPTA